MLVLSRKRCEEVIVPQYGIVLTVLEVRGDKVRLGFSAPPDVHVHRREVWERLQRTRRRKRTPRQKSGRGAQDAQQDVLNNDL
jgi:carbon storage regulator